MLMGEVRAEGLMRAIDPVVRAGLSLKQEEAIRAAARQDTWKRHPVDVCLALPTPFGRLYLALVAGRERRSAARLSVEHRRYARIGVGSLAGSLVVGVVLIATVALAGLAVYGILAGATLP